MINMSRQTLGVFRVTTPQSAWSRKYRETRREEEREEEEEERGGRGRRREEEGKRIANLKMQLLWSIQSSMH